MADSDDEPMYSPVQPRRLHPPPLRAHHADNVRPRTLSSNALDALKEFYSERDARAKQFEQLKAAAEEKGATPTTAASASTSALTYPLSMEAFGEDWNESQFWVRPMYARVPAFLPKSPGQREEASVQKNDPLGSGRYSWRRREQRG